MSTFALQHEMDELLTKLNEREKKAVEFIATAIIDQRRTVKCPAKLLLHFNGEGQIKKWEMTQLGEFS